MSNNNLDNQLNLDNQIIDVLHEFTARASLSQILAALGVVPNRKGRYSKRAYAKYTAIGRELQKLKRAGKIEYVSGSGAGWRLRGARSSIRMPPMGCKP